MVFATARDWSRPLRLRRPRSAVYGFTARSRLFINGWDLTLDEEALVGLVLGVAAGVIGKDRLTAVFLDRCVARAEF